ncbi:MAG TPA: HAD-IB family phosphatase [Candidatus Binatia bacterium]|nr:HAD-IB family phosphatase [Candidatus Binatia bacterium]
MSKNSVRTIKAVIFDIDGTLTPQNSWTAFTKDIGGSVEEHLAIYSDHVNGKIGLDKSKELLLKMWQDTGKADKKHIEGIFETWQVRDDAQELIDWLKDNGYIVCLITGSVGVYAKYMARKLGVEYYYSNAELYFDDNGELADFHYTANQAEVKLEQFGEFSKLMKLRASDFAAVGDGDNDIGLFRLTNNGILVDHNKVSDELRNSAWKTVSNLIEVKDLLQANSSS